MAREEMPVIPTAPLALGNAATQSMIRRLSAASTGPNSSDAPSDPPVPATSTTTPMSPRPTRLGGIGFETLLPYGVSDSTTGKGPAAGAPVLGSVGTWIEARST